MDEELETFIRERKARMAEDKANLEQDPPYMEMKAKPHRVYSESTVKENIPPKSAAQDKEESSSVGLPLGVEYERKKQRLQHELRMDYRRYMAQKNHFGLESGPLIHLNNSRSIKQRPPSRRDAATLTDDSRRRNRTLRSLCPEEEEEQDSEEEEEEEEEEECFKELEVMEGRRRRNVGVEARDETRRCSRTDDRRKLENPIGSRSLSRDGEFATGLIIGASDTKDALQRRKQRYRQELEEQIAEQHRNKKREKDLELKVAATGANDPEKQPDRIRQFGLSRREIRQEAGNIETTSRRLLRPRETTPPDQPHVAFQSPLLDYSSSLGAGGAGGGGGGGAGGRLSPHSQPAATSFPRAIDTPRIPFFAPHPPSALSDAFRSPYGDTHHYYSTRNLLDPNVAYYGPLSGPGPGPGPGPGSGLPVSYWTLPPGGAPPLSRFGDHSPHSQTSGSSFPEPHMQPNTQSVPVSMDPVFPSDRSRSTRDRVLSYREALKQQIQEQQEQRRVEQEERQRYEAQLEADMRSHQPWGRGGGGAPLRDSTGNLIADLNQMHKLNAEAYINPEQRQRRNANNANATNTNTACRIELHDPNERLPGSVAENRNHDATDRLSGFAHVQTSQFARGKVFSTQPSLQQINEQDKYKAYLKQQIDEKMLKKAEERERIRLEEEKEEKRLEEQRARIQREYDEEQERKKRKEMEQKAKNEELVQLAQQRKQEVERKRNEEEEEERAELRRKYERERQARVEAVHRESSPPIPTLQKKHPHQYSPRPPTVDSQRSLPPPSERSLSGLQSPPVPARRNQLRAAGVQRDVYSELSALRRRLRSEEKRLEGRLQQVDWDDVDSPLGGPPLGGPPRGRTLLDLDSPLGGPPRGRTLVDLDSPRRRTLVDLDSALGGPPRGRTLVDLDSPLGGPPLGGPPRARPPLTDVFDMARLRLQAPVRTPNSRIMEPRNLRRIHESLQLRYTDAESRLGFGDVTKMEEVGVASQRRRSYRDQFSRCTVQDDYCDASPPRQLYHLRSESGSARGSLLESDRAFIDPLGGDFPEPRTPEEEEEEEEEEVRLPVLSARERRRLAKQPQRLQEQRRGDGRTRERTGGRRGNAAVELSDDDENVSTPLHGLHHGVSVETVSTETWRRPETSHTLRARRKTEDRLF